MTRNSKLIIDNLNVLFPKAKCELKHKNNFELLIAVILSAQTTDERVNLVTPFLFKTNYFHLFLDISLPIFI